jgi:hypothetical protein
MSVWAATPASAPLAIGAVLGAVLFGLTAFSKKANEIEAGHPDEVGGREMVDSSLHS